MEALIDTNVLVYRYDPRFPGKQRIAHELLRDGAQFLLIAVPHQAILEFVAATTRPRADLGGRPLLTRAEAYREAEEMLAEFIVVFPNDEVVATALRGAALYQLSWFDAHLWAYAEVFGIPQLYSEDFQHGRTYGKVRALNPFRALDETINEPSTPYG